MKVFLYSLFVSPASSRPNSEAADVPAEGSPLGPSRRRFAEAGEAEGGRPTALRFSPTSYAPVSVSEQTSHGLRLR